MKVDSCCYQQQQTSVDEDVEKLEPFTLLMGVKNGEAAMENGTEVPQNIKNRILRFSNAILQQLLTVLGMKSKLVTTAWEISQSFSPLPL